MKTSGQTYLELVIAAMMETLHITINRSAPATSASIRLGVFLVLEVALFVTFLLIASFFVY
ncbi:MAG: hypothetical protein U0175_36525 [Caldilineaceae bacterium]